MLVRLSAAARTGAARITAAPLSSITRRQPRPPGLWFAALHHGALTASSSSGAMPPSRAMSSGGPADGDPGAPGASGAPGAPGASDAPGHRSAPRIGHKWDAERSVDEQVAAVLAGALESDDADENADEYADEHVGGGDDAYYDDPDADPMLDPDMTIMNNPEHYFEVDGDDDITGEGGGLGGGGLGGAGGAIRSHPKYAFAAATDEDGNWIDDDDDDDDDEDDEYYGTGEEGRGTAGAGAGEGDGAEESDAWVAGAPGRNLRRRSLTRIDPSASAAASPASASSSSASPEEAVRDPTLRDLRLGFLELDGALQVRA